MSVIAESAWAFGWTAVAGIATAILAAVTWWLARSTRDLARETDQDVRAAWRPVVVLAIGSGAKFKVTRIEERYAVEIEVCVRNAGRGPAINCEIAAHTSRSEYDLRTQAQQLNTVAVGDQTPVRVYGRSDVAQGRPDWERSFDHQMLLTYEDVAQTIYETLLTFRVHADEGDSTGRGQEINATLISTEPRSTGRKREN